MDLDEIWQVGLKPEKTKPCTFRRNCAMGFGERAKKWVTEAFFVTCTTHHFCHFPWIDFHQLPTNMSPGAGSRHMVSHSRKVSIKGSNLPKNPLFRVPYL